jgi:hypothetical protein
MRPAIAALLSTFLGLATGHSAIAQEGTDFKPVEVETLRKDLSKFWAVGFTFLDTVTERPGAETVEVAKKSYVRFGTRTLGACYADASLGSSLDALKPGADFVFTATVLQNERGLFSFGRSPQYFVVAMKVQPALAEVTPGVVLEAGSKLADDSPDGRLLKNYSALIVGLQADLAAMARTRGIEPMELLKASSTNRPEVERIITTGIESLADQMEVRVPDVLGQLTMALLASHMKPAPKQEPATSDQAAPAVRGEEPNPARLKAERQKQAAAAAEDAARAKAAEDAEKRRLADEQAAKAAAEKQARLQEERERDAQAKAAAAQAKATKEDEQKRLANERAAKVRAEKQAQLERERTAQEKAGMEKRAHEEKDRLEKETREREAQLLRAKRETPKTEETVNEPPPRMRVPTPTEATPASPGDPVGVLQPAQPSAKLQPVPQPPAPKSVPEKAPAAPAEDYSAPIPL